MLYILYIVYICISICIILYIMVSMLLYVWYIIYYYIIYIANELDESLILQSLKVRGPIGYLIRGDITCITIIWMFLYHATCPMRTCGTAYYQALPIVLETLRLLLRIRQSPLLNLQDHRKFLRRRVYRLQLLEIKRLPCQSLRGASSQQLSHVDR
jgi:hypothetical protein